MRNQKETRDLSDREIRRILQKAPKVERLTDEEYENMRAAVMSYLLDKRAARRSSPQSWLDWINPRVAFPSALAGAFALILIFLAPTEFRAPEEPRNAVDRRERPAAPSGTMLDYIYHYDSAIAPLPELAWERIDSATATNADAAADNLCGPRGLWVAAMRVGVPLDLAEVIDACTRTQQGTSFKDLKEVAERFGLGAEGVLVDYTSLSQIPAPALIRVSGDHIVCVDPRRNGRGGNADCLRYYDYPNSPVWKDREEIESLWEGAALFISPAPRSASPGQPLAAFGSLLADFGIAETSSTVSFLLRNTGDSPLRVAEISKECSCMTLSLPREAIDPGSEFRIRAEVDVRGLRGPQLLLAEIETNDPLNPVVPLAVQGVAGNSIHVSTNMLTLDQFSPPDPATAEFIITDLGDQTLKLLSSRVAHSTRHSDRDRPSIEVTWQEVLAEAAKRNDSPYQGLLGYRVLVSASLPESASPGAFAGWVHILTDRSARPRLSVPFEFNLHEDFYSAPSRVAFGILTPGTAATRTLTIRRRADDAFSIADTTVTWNASGDAPLVVNLTPPSGNEQTLELTFSCPKDRQLRRATLAKGTIELRTEDGFLLHVPWTSILKPEN